MLTGFADYSLWYDEPKTMGTNLVVVEAKRSGNAGSGEAQCLAYMGRLNSQEGMKFDSVLSLIVLAIVHDIRKLAHKRHKVIYGICTDGAQYQFLRIDNNSAVHCFTKLDDKAFTNSKV